MANGVRNPQFEDEAPTPSYVMVLADLVELNNVERSARVNIKLPLDRSPMRPSPSTNAGFETTISYTALNVCNKQPFKDLYAAKKGKNIKLAFDGYVYFGYISNPIYTDYDIQFDFTYTARIQQLTEDPLPGFYSL
jgi:hypothetical protein